MATYTPEAETRSFDNVQRALRVFGGMTPEPPVGRVARHWYPNSADVREFLFALLEWCDHEGLIFEDLLAEAEQEFLACVDPLEGA